MIHFFTQRNYHSIRTLVEEQRSLDQNIIDKAKKCLQSQQDEIASLCSLTAFAKQTLAIYERRYFWKWHYPTTTRKLLRQHI